MNKTEIETNIENLFVRVCSGVIEHNKDFRLIKTFSGSTLTKYNIQCHAADCPRILGKKGARFKALKILMEIVGEHEGRQLKLETMLPAEVGEPKPFPKFKYNAKWPKDTVRILLRDLAEMVFKFPVEIIFSESVGAAILTVACDERESETLIELVAPALNNIFVGIGTTNGCQLAVDVAKK